MSRTKDSPTLYVKLLSKGLSLGGGGRKKERLFPLDINANVTITGYNVDEVGDLFDEFNASLVSDGYA